LLRRDDGPADHIHKIYPVIPPPPPEEKLHPPALPPWYGLPPEKHDEDDGGDEDKNDRIYFGGPPYDINPPYPPLNRDPYTKFGILADVQAIICCAGFNPQDSRLEAIIKLTIPANFKKDFCSDGLVARVGFWIHFQSTQEKIFCGEGTVHVYDLGQGPAGSTDKNTVYYAVHQTLAPNLTIRIKNCSDGAQLPELWCWLKTIQDPNTNNQVFTPVDDYTTYEWIEASGTIDNYQPLKIKIPPTLPKIFFPILDTDFGNVKAQDKRLIQFPKKSSYGEFKFTLRKSPDVESQVFPMHAIILKNKKILLFSGSGNSSYIFNNEELPPELANTVALFDPDSETLQGISPPPLYQDDTEKTTDSIGFKGLRVYDVFCAGHSVLADGRVLIVGGTEEYELQGAGGVHSTHFPGVKVLSIFDPDTSSWRMLDSFMAHGRWYPSTLVLGDGTVYIMGGHPEAGYSDPLTSENHTNNDLEILNPSYLFKDDPYNLLWTRWNGPVNEDLSEIYQIPSTERTIANTSSPGTYPKIFLLPNGFIFCATLVTHIPASWGKNDIKKNNPAILMWDPLGYKNAIPSSNGKVGIPKWSIINRGLDAKGRKLADPFDTPNTWFYGSDGHSEPCVMLPLLPLNNYDPSIFLLKFDKAFVCRPLGVGNQKLWNDVSSGRKLTSPNDKVERLNGNALLLPDGTVLCIGGVQHTGDHLNPATGSDSDAVLSVEIFDPLAPIGKQWSIGAKITRPRNYHCTAVLLYNGKVLLAGSDRDAQKELISQDLSYDIYTPDYLWRGPRPEFAQGEDVVRYGNRLNIRLGKEWKVSDLNLDKCCVIRTYAMTHTFGYDERYVGLKVGIISDSEFFVSIPNNSSLLPPGYYYLFLVSKAGAPSIGHIIQILHASEDWRIA
jgi:hypothetical protein